MAHVTISLKQFCSLRSGDLVIWHGRYLRTVVKGPSDNPNPEDHPTVIFPIRRRSWRQRIDTVYNYNDMKCAIRVADKRTNGLMLPSEWKTLEVSGFDVRRELKRELKDAEGIAERMGQNLCKAYPKIRDLIKRA
jgi:hypothetical protein